MPLACFNTHRYSKIHRKAMSLRFDKLPILTHPQDILKGQCKIRLLKALKGRFIHNPAWRSNAPECGVWNQPISPSLEEAN